MSKTSTRTIVEFKGKTVYRKCACRETAHDVKFIGENSSGTKFFSYPCRNCFTLAQFRK